MTTIPVSTLARRRHRRPSGTMSTRAKVEHTLRHGEDLSEEDASTLHGIYVGQLTSYATRIGATDPEAMADLALFDTFRAHARKPILDEPAFRAYAYRAVRSHTLNEARRRTPVPVDPDETSSLDPCPVAEAEGEAIIERLWLNEILDQLTDDQVAVLQMRLVEGLSAEEVGRRLGRAPNAVYQLQHRAQHRLRRLGLAAALAVVAAAAVLAVVRGQSNRITIEPAPVDQPATTTLVPAEPDAGTRSTVVVEVAPVGDADDLDPALQPVEEGKVGPDQTAGGAPSTADAGGEQLVTSTSVAASPPTSSPPVDSTETTVDTTLAGVKGLNPAAPSTTSAAVVGTRPNMCRVDDDGQVVLVELFDLSLSDLNGDDFVAPVSYTITAVDQDGVVREIRSQNRIKPASYTGWTEGGKPLLASPASGESRWAIYVGQSGLTVTDVSYVLAEGEDPINPCGSLGP